MTISPWRTHNGVRLAVPVRRGSLSAAKPVQETAVLIRCSAKLVWTRVSLAISLPLLVMDQNCMTHLCVSLAARVSLATTTEALLATAPAQRIHQSARSARSVRKAATCQELPAVVTARRTHSIVPLAKHVLLTSISLAHHVWEMV